MRKKICSKCGKEKSIKCFYKRKEKYGDGYRGECKKCHSNYNLKYRLYKNFNLSLNEYNQLLKNQNGKCIICGQKPKNQINNKGKKGRRLSVDHNHKTGHIRGLLCNYCNFYLLRFLKDDKNRAFGLINYLNKAINNDINWHIE